MGYIFWLLQQVSCTHYYFSSRLWKLYFSDRVEMGLGLFLICQQFLLSLACPFEGIILPILLMIHPNGLLNEYMLLRLLKFNHPTSHSPGLDMQ